MSNRLSGFAARLKQAREKAGLTVLELSRQSGLTRSAIYKLEEGGQDSIYVSTAEKLAKCLQITPAWLCFGDDSPSHDLHD